MSYTFNHVHVMTASGLVHADELHILAIMATTVLPNAEFSLWDKNGPPGGAYYGKYRKRQQETDLLTFPIPIILTNGLWVEMDASVSEVVVYTHHTNE